MLSVCVKVVYLMIRYVFQLTINNYLIQEIALIIYKFNGYVIFF